MRTLASLTLFLFAAVILGCSNALYFYETEKISVAALEGRPDPSQPIQVNVGVKQRVVIVAPPKKGGTFDAKSQVAADSDSVSVLSAFYFNKSAKSGTASSEISISTLMFTGDAAIIAKSSSAAIVTGLAIPGYDETAGALISQVKANGKCDKLRAIALKDYGALTEAEVQQATGLLLEVYTKGLHSAVQKQISTCR